MFERRWPMLVLLGLILLAGPLVRAEGLLPSSKHPSPADHSPAPEELAALQDQAQAADPPLLAQAKPPQGTGRPPGPPPQGEKSEGATDQSAGPPQGEKPQEAAGQPEAPAPQGEKAKADRKKDTAPLQASDEPIKILSKRLEADDKAQQVFFIGQVHATQGLTQLWCDRMVVHYSKAEAGQNQEVGTGNRAIKKIEVFGHVKVTKEDKTGTGQRGLYELEERRIILWGKAKLVQGQNTVAGERVTLYLDDNRAVVEGGEEKVEAILTPGQPKAAEGPEGGKGKRPPPGKPGGGRS